MNVLSMTFTKGQLVSGKYRIEGVLGQGGMATVFHAVHVGLDESVAIKVLHPEMANHKEVADRFMREARTAVRIKSDHVVRVLDVDTTEDGVPYMIMELLRGRDLSVQLQQDGPLDVPTAARYLIQACDAMAAAHALGIVHRDIKSANLFLASHDDKTVDIKVLDFGISKVPTQPNSTHALTATQALLGTPLYMSPEQLRSVKSVDPRADIWGLGCVLFEMLTGELPFARNSLPELCSAILGDEAPCPSVWSSRITRELDVVVLRCLEKSAEARYPNVFELANALLAFAPDMNLLVKRLGYRLCGTQALEPPEARDPNRPIASVSMPPSTPATGSSCRGRQGLLALAATVVTTVAGAAYWTHVRSLTSTATRTEPSTSAERLSVPSESSTPGPTVYPVVTLATDTSAHVVKAEASAFTTAAVRPANSARVTYGKNSGTFPSVTATVVSNRPVNASSTTPTAPPDPRTERNPLHLELK